MSERISPAAPPLMMPAAPAPPALDRLPARDLARLALGFYLVFWGALVLAAGLCESLTAVTLRLTTMFLLGAGNLAFLTGTWRLHQVRTLGDSWRRRTREMVVVAGLLAYLCPFYVMWRRLPANLYLLGHALAMLALFSYSLTMLCHTAAVLGRAAGRHSLVTQAILFGSVSVVVLFPPLAVFGQVMVTAARSGRDPLVLLQFWLGRSPLFWMVPVTVLPLPLTLSLVWAAKDEVLHRLLAAPEGRALD